MRVRFHARDTRQDALRQLRSRVAALQALSGMRADGSPLPDARRAVLGLRREREGPLMPSTQSTPVYGGRATVNFHEYGHRYEITIPGLGLTLRHPSMTTILKALGSLDNSGLFKWAAGLAAEHVLNVLAHRPPGKMTVSEHKRIVEGASTAWQRSRDTSGKIGTHVHAVIEATLRGEDDPYAALVGLDGDDLKRATVALDKAQRFLDANRILPVGIERAFWSPTFGVVGTADLPAVVNGRLAITDWKVSKWIGLAYRLQLTGYAALWEEETGEVVLDRRVVAFGADGEDPKVQTWDRESFHTDVRAFKGVIDQWRWLVANDPFYRGRSDYDPPLTADQLEAFWELPAEEAA